MCSFFRRSALTRPGATLSLGERGKGRKIKAMQSSGRDDNLGAGVYDASVVPPHPTPLPAYAEASAGRPLGEREISDTPLTLGEGNGAMRARGLLENPATIIAVLLTLMVAFFALAR